MKALPYLKVFTNLLYDDSLGGKKSDYTCSLFYNI